MFSKLLFMSALATSAALSPGSTAAMSKLQTAAVATKDVTVTKVAACEILDSRGNPTVEVEVFTSMGMFRASVPSGASTGVHEACELRDGDKKRYMGKGVLKAVANVNDLLGPAVIGLKVTDQRAIDDLMIKMDDTPNKSNLGANAILGVSLAVAKAGAAANGLPLYAHIALLAGNDKLVLPVPAFNVINGGSHAGNKLAFQEYFMIPTGAETFSEALQIGTECYHTLRSIIKKKFGGDATLIGDEGGFAPPCDAREGVELVMEAIKTAGYEGKCMIGMDVAASEFKVEGEDCYDLGLWYPQADRDADPSLKMTGEQLMAFYKTLVDEFPIVTIEDAFDEDDWENWSKFSPMMAAKIQSVGDDITVTNPIRIQRAIDEDACNALLLKVNQIGSVSESIDAVKLAKSAGWGIMTSHRSGETEDTYIADIAVGLCSGQIKTGAPCRSERLAKYNQLLRIETELGEDAIYAGNTWRKPAWMADFKE